MANAPIRTPTSFRPVSGMGSVATIGMLPIVEIVNMLPIVDTATHLPILTNPTVTLPKNATLWTQTG